MPLVLALASASIALTQVKLEITKSVTETRIEMPADVLFDFDKADIKPGAAATLDKAVAVLQQQHVTAARIEGHTDAKGSPAYNQTLSERRAAAVYNWFQQIATLNGVKFSPRGFGATKPVAPNIKPDGSDDPIGRAKNRRVEIVFNN